MQRGDRGFDLKRTWRPRCERLLQHRAGFVDCDEVPSRSILVGQWNRRATVVEPRVASGIVELHQAEQTGGFACFGERRLQRASYAKRETTEVRSDRCLVGG